MGAGSRHGSSALARAPALFQWEGVSASPNRVIPLLSLAAFASAATTRVCDGLLPQIAADFGVTVGAAGWVITAYSATYGLLQIAYGLGGDRLGKARVILFGVVLSLVATAACALAATLPGLILARLLAGAAAAGIIPLSVAWIGDAVPYEKRQAIIARFITGQIGGVVVGLAFGGLIGELLGWRAAFWLIGFLYVVAGLGLVGWFRHGLVAPIPAETRQSAMATVAGVLANPWARRVYLITFLEGFLCFGAFAYLSAALRARFGLGLGASGLIVAAFGLGGAGYALVAPRFVPRFGEAGGARLSSAFFALGFLGLAVAPAAWLTIPAALCVGIGYYMLHNVLQVNATQMAPEARGAAVALFATAFFVGQGLGVAAAAPVVDRLGTAPVFVAVGVLLPLCALLFARALERRVVPPGL